MTGQHATVVGFDGSRSALAALEWAVADARESSSDLVILNVAEWGPLERPSASGRCRLGPREDASRRLLAEAYCRVRRLAPDLPVSVSARVGGTSHCLVEASRTARVLVLGLPQYSQVEGNILGSATGSVVARARCPVVVVSPGVEPDAVDRLPITIGFTRAPDAVRALDFAAERAARHEVPLLVVIAEGEYRDDLALEAGGRLGRLIVDRAHRAFPGVQVLYEVARGTVGTTVTGACTGPGLIVVGHRDLTPGLLAASVRNGLITTARSPLAVVP